MSNFKSALVLVALFLLAAGSVQAQDAGRDSAILWLPDIPPEVRAVVNSLWQYTVAGLESAELAEHMGRFGFTDDTIAEAISARLEEASFADGMEDLGRNLAFSYATDVIAESFADIMMDSVYVERLPDRLRNPLRAMLEATVREGFGVAETIIVDSATVGPFALVFPLLDRVQDTVEIIEATRGVAQARTATLISAALGAELTAQLVTRYPSAESERVASQWLEETRDTLRDVSSPEEHSVLVAMLEDGLAALTAVQGGSCDAECQAAIVRLESYRREGSALGRWIPLSPTESFAQAILDLTSLQANVNVGQGTEGGQTLIPAGAGEGLSVVSEETLEEEVQKERNREICERYRAGTEVVTGARMVTEVHGLTGYYRDRAIACMRPKQSFVVSPAELAQLTYGLSPNQQQHLLCSFRENLPVPQNAQSYSALFDGVTGYGRERVISCMRHNLETESLTVDEALQILGSLVPERYAGWDGTLIDYNPGHHITALCHLSEYLVRDLEADQVARLLGQSRDRDRERGVRCIRQAISHGLTWDEVELILGPSIYRRGAMIDALGERTPDGLNARRLDEFMRRYRNGRYLNDPDPPDWLAGQCIAFARLAYRQVTGADLAIQFGQASNVVARSESAGLVTETDARNARVGALVVWDDGGAGHVGVVVGIVRDSDTGLASRIAIAESNWDVATEAVTRIWGLSLEEARREIVTNSYGRFDTVTLPTDSLDRPPPGAKEPISYGFVGYVLP